MVFFLNILFRVLVLGKYNSTNFKNSLLSLVFTFTLKVGLKYKFTCGITAIWVLDYIMAAVSKDFIVRFLGAFENMTIA